LENNKYQHPLGSNGEAKCPFLGCIAPKKQGETGTIAAQVFLLYWNYFS
jgi:hypothetical protein